MSVNPQDYSREERKNGSWWSSRHRFRDGTSSLRRSRRLTLFDLLLLLVMMGVLLPWFLHMNRSIEAGSYKIVLDERFRDESLVLILKISLSRGGTPEAGDIVGWCITDESGVPVHEEYDLPPESGNPREFIFMTAGDGPFRCEVSAGSETVELQTESRS